MTLTAESLAPEARRPRPVRTGVVESDKGDKTIKVVMEYQVRHPKYGKYIKRRTRLHAHDVNNDAKMGDVVEIMECRPISKTKRWRLVRVIKAAPQSIAERVSGS